MSNKKIDTRTFPGYTHKSSEWGFYHGSYVGGSTYMKANLHKFEKEGDSEFTERQKRAYRENHSKNVVDIINSYLFKKPAERDIEKASDELKGFINNMDGQGNNAHSFMKLTGRWGDVFGRVYIVMDRPRNETGYVDDKDPDNLPYCYHVFPTSVKDVAFDENGDVRWALIQETYRDDETFEEADDELQTRYRLWLPEGYKLYDKEGNLTEEDLTMGWKRPPITYHDPIPNDTYSGISLLESVAGLDKAIFNNISKYDVILTEQTFSQLIMSITSIPFNQFDASQQKDVLEQYQIMAANRILLYNGADGAPPAFIGPDPQQAEVLSKAIIDETNSLYATAGLSKEVGTEVGEASGVAKAYDFDKLNRMLSSRSNSLEDTERAIYDLYAMWMDEEDIHEKVKVDYPDSFDIKTLDEEVENAERLLSIDMPPVFDKEVKKGVALRALAKLEPKKLQEILLEIESFDPGSTFDIDNELTK